MNTREKIFEFIQQNKRVSPKMIADNFDLGKPMIHRHLKKLLEEEKIKREGEPPIVFYKVKENFDIDFNFSEKEKKFLENNFLYITPKGERLEGVEGFIVWCQERGFKAEEKVGEYIKILEKYEKNRKNFIFDVTSKLKSSFEKVCAKKLFYLEFNSYEIFGKTKLGQMILYAKQGQDKKEMKKIIDEIKDKILFLIKKEKIDSVIFVPPTVKREIQFMKVLEKGLKLNLPVLNVVKIKNDIAVPQKTLKKIKDRQENAEATFEVLESGSYKKTLIIDDAVGSGATINEISCKLKERKVSKEIMGISIVGSLNGFEIISEV